MSSAPLNTFNVSGTATSSSRSKRSALRFGLLWLQLTDRLHHLRLELFANADQVRVLNLLLRFDVFAVGTGQVALDDVVFEADGGGLLVTDVALALVLGKRGERNQREHPNEFFH